MGDVIINRGDLSCSDKGIFNDIVVSSDLSAGGSFKSVDGKLNSNLSVGNDVIASNNVAKNLSVSGSQHTFNNISVSGVTNIGKYLM